MTQERKGVITFMGGPLTLLGPEIKAGDKAPDFQVLDKNFSAVSFTNFTGKTKLISVVPSLDTPVCDAQTRRFNVEAGKLPDSVAVLTISVDLPFAQGRFCSVAGINKIQVFSDYRDLSFGNAYGVVIKELRLLTRAIFIIGPDDVVKYVEYVKEITQQPNYDAALQVLRK